MTNRYISFLDKIGQDFYSLIKPPAPRKSFEFSYDPLTKSFIKIPKSIGFFTPFDMSSLKLAQQDIQLTFERLLHQSVNNIGLALVLLLTSLWHMATSLHQLATFQLYNAKEEFILASHLALFAVPYFTLQAVIGTFWELTLISTRILATVYKDLKDLTNWMCFLEDSTSSLHERIMP